VKDLAMPDAVYHFQNFSLFGVSSLNLMPLLMAITMIIQMKVGPKAGDKMQQRIFMFMPLIFLFICYNFASALALYWTGQNIFSIGQTWLMNRRPEPELVKRPAKKRMSLQDMQKARAAGNKPEKKPKKRKPRTGG
jgi:YidC/Oxa1 family membrane protein insertase